MPKKQLKSLDEGEEYALRLLSIRDYSREEMQHKFEGKGLRADAAEEVLRKLEARGLLDDERYAQRLAAFYTREKLLGPQRVVQKLRQKGISLELAKETTRRAEQNGASQERLRKVLRMKLKGQGLDQIEPRQKKRLANHLFQRGFLWEDVLEALREVGGSAEE